MNMYEEITSHKVRLLQEAQELSTIFTEASKAVAASKLYGQQTLIGTRVRVVGGSLTCEWFRKNFVSSKDNPYGKKKVFSTYLRLGKGGRYSHTLFRREPEWARTLIESIEEQYSLLRKQWKSLTLMERELRRFEAFEHERKVFKGGQ